MEGGNISNFGGFFMFWLTKRKMATFFYMLRFCIGLLIFLFASPFGCSTAQALEREGTLAQGNSNNLVWSIFAQTGFQKMDLSFDAPFTTGALGPALFYPSPLDLELHNSDLWVGGLGADVRKGRFSGFFEARANIPKDTDVTASSEPFWAGTYPVEWNDCELNWRAINAGVGFDITRHFSIQVGLKVEHLSLDLENPVDSAGLIPRYVNTYGDSYSGDLESELLIPWIGIRAQASRLTADLRYSPYAHTDLKIPLTYTYISSPVLNYIENEDYSFRDNGHWFEATLAYDFFKSTKWLCSLWTEASWLWTDGNTSLDYRITAYPSGLPATTVYTGSTSEDGKYKNSTYGAGLRITYYF